MTNGTTYLVDSDVFITAKNLYYAFGLCPGSGRAFCTTTGRAGSSASTGFAANSSRAARQEDLVRWVKGEVPREFFLPVDADAVVSAYTEIMMWVQRHGRYFDHAKAKFATGADGWLVACAWVQGAAVVTNEREAPESRREIKLPDVCEEFGVEHPNVFEMLRALDVQFDWAEDR